MAFLSTPRIVWKVILFSIKAYAQWFVGSYPQGWSRCDPTGDKMFAIYVSRSKDRVDTCVIAWSHCGGDLFQKLWLDRPIAFINTFKKSAGFYERQDYFFNTAHFSGEKHRSWPKYSHFYKVEVGLKEWLFVWLKEIVECINELKSYCFGKSVINWLSGSLLPGTTGTCNRV